MEKKEKLLNHTEEKGKKKRNKSRMWMVILFMILFASITYVTLRGSYLEYKELGENFVEVFFTNLKYRYITMGINFVFLYFVIYLTNRGIKKGLKTFFEKENKQMPKLPNKSLALIFSAIVSVGVSNVLMQKILLLVSNASFGVTDPIFNMDIGYFMFQKPFIQTILLYFLCLIVGLTIYMAIYYILVFNRNFDGVDGKMIRKSLLLKKITRNILLMAIGIAILTVLNTQNIVFNKMLNINHTSNTSEAIEIIGAGYTDVTIQRWGYIGFAAMIVIFIFRALKSFEKQDTKGILKNLAMIPIYLIGLFVVMIGFDLIFVNSNKLDREKKYLAYNIEGTKNAYQINIQETSLKNSGTITNEEIKQNQSVINNIPVINQDIVLKTLEDNQTGTGYYSYHTANLAQYEIKGTNQLVYVAPREMANSGRSYSNKTYEYTHGMGQIVVSATQANTTTGNVQYIQKEVSGKDDKLGTEEQRIYFGLNTNETIATNTKNKKEYDYTDENGTEYTSNYNGIAGLNLNFIDRIILGITKGDVNLALSNEITSDSKILINRNIIKRAKKAMPYLIYDENPYTVVTEEGRIVWVLDAYTVSSNYPYSQYTSIEHDGVKEKINYIRNSVKVLIDSYDGTMSYYVIDKTDPIAMSYRNLYPKLFQDLNEEIPRDIAKHFVYPQYLYEIQAKMLKTYHNVKPDVLYRTDDLWDFAKYNNSKIAKSTGSVLEPYYTMVKTKDEEDRLGLVQIYTPNEKQNLISYLVGTVENGNNQLKLYKFSEDSNIVGPMQLDKQVEADEAISAEIESLNTTGAKVTKSMIVVPIDNTLLYIEPIYQTMLNETKVPVLKRVVVASGNKVAIGDNLQKALENLLSKYAVDIEVENTEDVQGLIEAIIKANHNLTESNSNNDWEMMGKDIKKLQTLIDSLETVKEQEDKKQEELEKANKNNNTTENQTTNTEKNTSGNTTNTNNNDTNS